MGVREGIKVLVDGFFSSTELHRGQVGFDHIIKDYGEAGTTCGFVPHWMLWRMGCTDQKLVQRYEPDGLTDYTSAQDDFGFRVGTGISAVSQHSAFSARKPELKNATKLAAAFFAKKLTLKCGDIAIVKGKDFTFAGKPAGSEHIFVVMEATWQGADTLSLKVVQGGQGMGAKGQFANRADVLLKRTTGPFEIGDKSEDGPVLAAASALGPRALIGYLDIEQLPFASARDTPDMLELTKHSTDITDKGTEKHLHGQAAAEVGSVWKADVGGEPRLYVFYKGHRVFWVDPTATWRFAGSGVWFATGGGLRIVWGAGESENWLRVSPATAFGVVVATGTSVTANKVAGKDYKAVLQSFKNSAGPPIG